MNCTGATDRPIPAALTHHRSPREFYRYPTEILDMLNHVSLAFTVALAGSVLVGSLSYSHELPRFGTLPELASEWQLQESSADEITPEANSFRWVVFRNSESGDLLSFATFPRNDSATPLGRFSDTALEIFPDGLAVWDHNTTPMTIEAITISTRERRLSIRRRLPVLEYSFVSEAATRPNLMANGRAWFERDYIIFVQHTSHSPISPSVVDGLNATTSFSFNTLRTRQSRHPSWMVSRMIALDSLTPLALKHTKTAGNNRVYPSTRIKQAYSSKSFARTG